MIGEGAFKKVYKGYDNDSGCEIAWNIINLKKLPKSNLAFNSLLLKMSAKG